MDTRRRIIKDTAMSELLNKLDCSHMEVERYFPMKKYVTLKVGGNAEAVVYPNDKNELVETLNEVHRSGLDFIILGAGSNTIITDRGVSSIVISTKKLKGFTIMEVMVGMILEMSAPCPNAIATGNTTSTSGIRYFEIPDFCCLCCSCAMFLRTCKLP